MNRQQISEMLRLQDKLNLIVDPNWLTADFPWHRAIYVEAVEALDHYGWKWWKAAGAYTIGQIQLELVDIWHFAMSHILAIHEGDYEAAATLLHDYFIKLEENPDVYGDIKDVSVHQLFDLLAGSAAIQRQLNGPAFNMLMKHFNLTWDQLYRTYVNKNVLNLFRQANGYKEGTYVKMWNGVEDNVVLEALAVSHPDATPGQLMSLLENQYKLLVAA